jgi:epsilon-lactone hydrolase
LSRELDAVVAFPLYELCPEQTLDKTILEIGFSYQVLQHRLPEVEMVMMADSAGGFLATRLLQSIHKRGGPLPRALVLLSPFLDLDPTSPPENDPVDPVIDWELLQWLCALAKTGVDPRAIMLDWTSLGYFPPTYLVASEDEILTDHSKRLESALRQQRVPVQAVYWPQLFHAFPLLNEFLPEAKQAVEDVKRWLEQVR